MLAKPYPTAKVEDLQTFKKAQLSQIDQLLTIVTLLLALSLLIALIGVVNTLLLSVYERTREIGLLRAVGETRRQLRRSVSEESVIITLLGTFLGLVIGMCFAWALIRALADQHLERLLHPGGPAGRVRGGGGRGRGGGRPVPRLPGLAPRRARRHRHRLIPPGSGCSRRVAGRAPGAPIGQTRAMSSDPLPVLGRPPSPVAVVVAHRRPADLDSLVRWLSADDRFTVIRRGGRRPPPWSRP